MIGKHRSLSVAVGHDWSRSVAVSLGRFVDIDMYLLYRNSGHVSKRRVVHHMYRLVAVHRCV